MFSALEESDDIFEVEILTRIKSDYSKFHKNHVSDYIHLLNRNSSCPHCGSNDVIRYGTNKSGSLRYQCKSCNKTFSSLKESLFFSSKVNISAWFAFLECLLSECSAREACIVAKISPATGSQWTKKVFQTLKKYQSSIILDSFVYIDETYVHEDTSKTYLLDEIGKIKKVKKQPRGISRNKICILVATDQKNSIAQIVCHGRPQRKLMYNICKNHIEEYATLIGDLDTSLTYTAELLHLNRIQYKSNTYEAYEKLEPIDKLCARLKFFLDKHRGFKKEILQDYLNLFIYIENSKKQENDLYKRTVNLIKMMFAYKKSGK